MEEKEKSQASSNHYVLKVHLSRSSMIQCSQSIFVSLQQNVILQNGSRHSGITGGVIE